MNGQPAKKETLPLPLAELRELSDRAEKGEADARALLRAKIEESGQWAGEIGDMAVRAENRILETYSRPGGEHDRLHEEIMRCRVQRLKEELAGPDPSPLERLLAERIALCWLQANHAAALEEIAMSDPKMFTSATLELAGAVGKGHDRAHKRLLSAIKTLALVRKLGVPAIQVNIGEKQFNVSR